MITLTAGRGPTLFSDSPVSEFLPYPPQAVNTVAPNAATVTQKAEKDTTECPSTAETKGTINTSERQFSTATRRNSSFPRIPSKASSLLSHLSQHAWAKFVLLTGNEETAWRQYTVISLCWKHSPSKHCIGSHTGNAVFAKHLASVVITKQTVFIVLRRLVLN